MLAYLRGCIVSKGGESAIIEAGGLGYEVFFCAPSLEALGPEGSIVEVFLAESISMYGGTALYGFRSADENPVFVPINYFRGNEIGFDFFFYQA